MNGTTKLKAGVLGVLLSTASISMAAPPHQFVDPMIYSLKGTVGYGSVDDYVATSSIESELVDGLQARRSDGCTISLLPNLSVDDYGRVLGVITVEVVHPDTGSMGTKNVPVQGFIRFDETRTVIITPDSRSTVLEYDNGGTIRGAASSSAGEPGEYSGATSLNIALSSNGALIDGSPVSGSSTNHADEWSLSFAVTFEDGSEAEGSSLLTSFDRQTGQFFITRDQFAASGSDSYSGDAVWISPLGTLLGGTTELSVNRDLAKAVYDRGGKKLDATVLRHRAGDIQAVQLGYSEAPMKRIEAETEEDPYTFAIVPMEEIVQTPNARTWTYFEYPQGVPR